MRARTLLATIAATAFVLAGCGGESPKPKAYSTPTGQISTSSNTANSPPPVSESDDASAVEYVRFYLAEFAKASNTGKTAALSELGQQGCKSCRLVIDAIRDAYDAGGWARHVSFTLSAPSVARDKDSVSVLATVRSPSQLLKKSRNARVEKVPPITSKTRFDLARGDRGWIINEWTRL